MAKTGLTIQFLIWDWHIIHFSSVSLSNTSTKKKLNELIDYQKNKIILQCALTYLNIEIDILISLGPIFQYYLMKLFFMVAINRKCTMIILTRCQYTKLKTLILNTRYSSAS